MVGGTARPTGYTTPITREVTEEAERDDMTPKLIEPGSQAQQTREIPIRGKEFVIGRGTDCDLRLRDPNVSRHHCMIRIRPDEVTLVDLGSSNGSYVNGTRVISQLALQSGDEIRLAEYRFILDLGVDRDKIQEKTPDVDPVAETVTLEEVRALRRKQ
jgi:pSer/pThr/pTyr-binding forkhead associated (FHA) protein